MPTEAGTLHCPSSFAPQPLTRPFARIARLKFSPAAMPKTLPRSAGTTAGESAPESAPEMPKATQVPSSHTSGMPFTLTSAAPLAISITSGIAFESQSLERAGIVPPGTCCPGKRPRFWGEKSFHGFGPSNVTNSCVLESEIKLLSAGGLKLPEYLAVVEIRTQSIATGAAAT